MPKASRMEIKSKVKQFLIQKLGSEEKLKQVIMWAKTSHQMFSTYGIPQDMELDFKQWAAVQLRQEFGSDLVPLADWESN